ncbi:TPA: hypothetical protein JLQ69_003518 [Escherichia coli]|nr:hypothetical protein [Escherichia coli]
MKNIHDIEAQLIGARTDLAAALERGDDTRSYRNAVVELEQELAAAQREQTNAERARQRTEHERLGALSAGAVHAAQEAVADAAGATEVAGVQMPAPEDDPEVANAAARLAAARDRLVREDARYTAAYGEWATINKRLVEKQRQRDEIVARRASGDERPEDGAELTALNLDIGSLQSMAADRHIAAEQLKPTSARRLVADAEAALKKAQDEALFNLRKARIRALELALIDEHAIAVSDARARGLNEFTSLPMLRETQRIIHRTATWEDR